jgi:hypothetical protein
MFTTKSSPEKRIFDWQDEQQVKKKKCSAFVLYMNIIVIFLLGDIFIYI